MAPVTAGIECGKYRHRITWRRGKLVLEDHDVLAERSLAALGSELPRCVEVLDFWRRLRGTERLYELLLAEPYDGLSHGSLDRLVARRDAGWSAEVARQTQRETDQVAKLAASLAGKDREEFDKVVAVLREDAKRRHDIALVEALSPELRRAMVLSMVVKVSRRWDDELYRRKHGRPIEAALGTITRPLIEQTARRWRRNVKPYARFAVEARLAAPQEEPSGTGRLNGEGASVVLSLPLGWFFDVWARGVVLVDDCFVLGRADGPADQTSMRVTCLRWERDARHASRPVPAPAIATRTGDGDWSLRWV